MVQEFQPDGLTIWFDGITLSEAQGQCPPAARTKKKEGKKEPVKLYYAPTLARTCFVCPPNSNLPSMVPQPPNPHAQ
jgi:hypothetical protein